MEEIRRGSAAIDSSVFIYYAEANPQFGAAAHGVFSLCEAPKKKVFASTLVITEVLTGYRKKKDREAEDTFWNIARALAPGLIFLPVTVAVADTSADFRAKYNLRTPDALHIAAAIQADAGCFITNDRRLKAVKEIPVLLLAELAKPV